MRRNYMAHTCVRFALRATSGLPLDRSKGSALDASRKLVLRTAFSAVSFCNAVAKTVEIE